MELETVKPLRLPLDLDVTPGAALRCLRGDRMPFALTGHWAGGGAILGSEPVRVAHGLEALDAVAMDETPASPGFVGGGWVGYLGFGLGEAVERLPPAPPRPVPLPLATLGFYDHVLRLDDDGRWWFEALDEAAVGRRFEDLRRRLATPVRRLPWRLDGMTFHGAGADGHRMAVEDCVERIAAGELLQANLCLRLDGRFEGSAADAYADAADALRPPYGAFVGSPAGGLLSFSPELFLRRSGRDVETAPIKGTARRGHDRTEAIAAREALVASAKDGAEHVMIVDLMRNDLGRVAEYGSVRAALEPDVEPHPGLWHLVSRVGARLRPEVTDRDLLLATFPPGSVTGAPKVQSLKVISLLEGTAREAYTGAIGFASPAAGLELNVAIRTLEVCGPDAWLGCGGGIVADSSPEDELREALAKARPIAEALGATVPEPDAPRTALGPRGQVPPGSGAAQRRSRPAVRRPDPRAGLLETILVRDGRGVHVDRHLRRLSASARWLYGLAPPGDLARRIEASGRLAGPDSARLRVVLRPDGTTDVTTEDAQAPPEPVTLEVVTLAGGLGAHKWADRTALAAFEGPGRAGLVCDLDGAALEASSASLWALVGERLVTPRADGRILAGVTRRRLLDLGRIDGVAIEEADVSLDDVRGAAAVVVTSAVRIAAAAALGPAGPTDRAHRLASAIRVALGPDATAAGATSGS